MEGNGSSFAFLAAYGPLYLRLATVAERALALDPNLTVIKTRQLAEAFARHAAARANEARPRRRRLAEAAALAKPNSTIASNGNGHGVAEGAPLDLVVAAFQNAQRLTASAIGEATGLDATALKAALKALVDGGLVWVEGKARGTSYVWSGR